MTDESVIITKIGNLIHEISETLIQNDDHEEIRGVYRYIKGELERILH